MVHRDVTAPEAWGEDGYPQVFHLISSLAIGGTERQLVEFIRRSSFPERHRVIVLDEPGALSDRLPNPPILLFPGASRVRGHSYLRHLRVAIRARRVLRGLQVGLLHAHLGFSELVASLAAPRSAIVIASRRGRNIGFEGRPWLRLAEGIGHLRTRVLLCNSRELARYARVHDLWVPPTKVIYNGIDMTRFADVAPPPPVPPTVAVVANFNPYKGHELFLRAFAAVVRDFPDARALLIGDGLVRPAMASLTEDLGIARNVEFTGQVSDPRPFVERAHVVSLVSHHEGFPNALLEGMAMGRPVVATAVGGIPELVRRDIDGYLVQQAPSEVARALLAVLRDDDLRSAMGVSARERAAEFGWDRVVRETEDVYRQLLRRPARGPARGSASCAG